MADGDATIAQVGGVPNQAERKMAADPMQRQLLLDLQVGERQGHFGNYVLVAFPLACSFAVTLMGLVEHMQLGKVRSVTQLRAHVFEQIARRRLSGARINVQL